uniref:Uncharacterized protein n=1 Tax=Triatoma infestans TaxID=30076 RepID=A0A170XVC8_TRIIF
MSKPPNAQLGALPPTFEEVTEYMKSFLAAKAEELKKTKGLSAPRNDMLGKLFKEHNEKVIQKLNEINPKVQEELKANPELQSFIEKLKIKLKEDSDKLKVANSEVIGTTLSNTWDTVTKQIDKSYKEIKEKGQMKKNLNIICMIY